MALWRRQESVLLARLKAMPAAQLAKAEVMLAAPARYHVLGMAINIVTTVSGGAPVCRKHLQCRCQHTFSAGQPGLRNVCFQWLENPDLRCNL